MDQANDVETISDDQGIGEVVSDQRPTGRGQVHADDADPVPAFEFAEIVLQCQLAAAEYHIVDLVFGQITEGGCKPVLSGKEVFVNAEHAGTLGTLQFRRLAAEKILKVTLYRGVPNALPFSQPAAVDAVPVQLEDVAAERLGRPLVFENPGKLLPEIHATAATQPFVRLDVENTPARAQAFMPNLPPVGVHFP